MTTKRSKVRFSNSPLGRLKTRVIEAFWVLERATPPGRALAWRVFYDMIARAYPQRNIHFLNWGYIPLEGEAEIAIDPAHEIQRTCVQLYAHTLDAVDLRGKEVVEVGSGRGGGASWIAQSQAPRSTVGVELAPRAVELARDLHRGVSNLDFRRGNALALPFPDASVDAVVNVESCHHYESMPRFLSEVVRVLRPGGHLLIADYRQAADMPQLEADLAGCDLTVLKHRDITANVFAALEQDNQSKEALLAEHVSWPFRTIMRTFMANRGTPVYEGFRTRQWLYGSWVLQKAPSD